MKWILITTLFLVGCAASLPAQCVQDSDCVMVKEDCCGCQAGGQSTVIHKDLVEQYEANMSCEDIFCAQVYLCDDTKEPRCVQNECVLA